MVDKIYAMSSFLQFRRVYDPTIMFSEQLGLPLRGDEAGANAQVFINTAEDLIYFLKSYVEREMAANSKTAIALSGGIDSASVAKFMPKGSVAYTVKSIVPGKIVFDETPRAKQYCDINGLDHRIIEVYWEDYEKYTPLLMKRKRAPIHSIEVQIYKMALQARQDGFERLIFADCADMVFGGLDGLISRDYTVGEYIERYSYVMPYKALKEFVVITEPFIKWANNGIIDVQGALNDIFSPESTGSFNNACGAADIAFVDAYDRLIHDPIDLPRIRSGDTKYIVREAFRQLYPGLTIPEKTPFPRAVNEWLADWTGPKREEFWPNCHINMTGDQKYYVWILEKFLNEFNL